MAMAHKAPSHSAVTRAPQGLRCSPHACPRRGAPSKKQGQPLFCCSNLLGEELEPLPQVQTSQQCAQLHTAGASQLGGGWSGALSTHPSFTSAAPSSRLLPPSPCTPRCSVASRQGRFATNSPLQGTWLCLETFLSTLGGGWCMQWPGARKAAAACPTARRVGSPALCPVPLALVSLRQCLVPLLPVMKLHKFQTDQMLRLLLTTSDPS